MVRSSEPPEKKYNKTVLRGGGGGGDEGARMGRCAYLRNPTLRSAQTLHMLGGYLDLQSEGGAFPIYRIKIACFA